MSDLSKDYGEVLALIEREEQSQGRKGIQPSFNKPTQKAIQPENKETLMLLDKYKGLLNSSLSDSKSNPSTNQSNVKPSTKSQIVENLESALKTKVINEFEEYRKYPRPYISISEILDCARKVFYTRKLYPINWNEQYVFCYLPFHGSVGQVIHKQLQDLLKLQDCEQSLIIKELSIKGKLDGRMGKDLYEIKTVDPEKYSKHEYIQSHYDQANIYCWLWNKLHPDDIVNHIVLVYACKDFKNVRTVDLDPNFDLASKMVMKAPYIKKCLDENVLPPACNDKEQCSFCYFKKQCKNDGEQYKKLNQTEDNKPNDVVILF